MPIINERLLGLLRNSLFLAGGAALLSIVFALPAAFFLTRLKLSFQKIIRVLLLVPILIPPYIHALSWRYLLVNLKIANYQEILFTLPAAILILSLAYFPIAFFLIENALKNLDANLENAALLFTSRIQTTLKIILPMIAPAIYTSLLFIFLLGLTAFGVPSFLHINTFVFEIFAQFSAFFNYQKAFMLTLPLLLITFTITSLWFLKNKDRAFITLSSASHPLQPIRVGGVVKLLVGAFFIFLIGSSVFLPLFSLFWQAGRLQSFVFAWTSSKSIIFTTLWLAGLAATLLTAFTFLTQVYLLSSLSVSRSLKFRNVARIAYLSILAIPSVSLGVILIKIFNHPFLEAVYTSFWIIIVGFFIRFLPYAAETLGTFWQQIDYKLLEAAQLSGVKTRLIAQKILLPLLAPGLLSAWLISFILSLGELGLIILIYPSGYQTLPIRIFTLLHYGAPELVAALSIILVGSVLSLAGVGTIIISRTKQYD